MSSFIIKLIAIICMTIDHMNYVLGRKIALNVIGRIAFPLYCFQLVVGYDKTRNLSKYISRLLIFAIISQIPYLFFINAIGASFQLNVLFTLSLGLVTMYLYDLKIINNNGKLSIIDKNDKDLVKKIQLKYDICLKLICEVLKYLMIFIILIVSKGAMLEYGMWGIFTILFIHSCYPFKSQINLLGKTLKTNKTTNHTIFLIGYGTLSIIKYIYIWNITSITNIVAFTIFTFIPAIIMLLSNGKKGTNLKYFFYIYYPIQFIIIYVILTMWH